MNLTIRRQSVGLPNVPVEQVGIDLLFALRAIFIIRHKHIIPYLKPIVMMVAI